MLQNFLRRVYLSPLGRPLSAVARVFSVLKTPYMIYGYYDRSANTFRKHTRLSDTVCIINKIKLTLSDHVWVWHYSILDASEGLAIGEGCQIGAWVGIFTHGSQVAIRLYGREYIRVPAPARKGYTRGSVTIGEYTFIGAGAIILPGVSIGRGCVIAAGSIVNKSIPDKSIVVGNPAKIIGRTDELDRKYLEDDSFWMMYYDQSTIDEIRSSTHDETI
jgi:acetyltransferase-like isoleucine patch superfamily enzyme